jgi:hypothetical protein
LVLLPAALGTVGVSACGKEKIMRLALWIPTACCLVSAHTTPFADSFEGFLGDYPIWMDLALPVKDGPVAGTYFYKKVGTTIALEGEAKGGKLVLREKDAKGKVAGAFACAWMGKDLAGDWGKPNAKQRMSVKLAATDPAYKAHAVHKFDALLLEDGTTLAATIKSLNAEEGSDGPAQVTFHYDQRNILSVEVSSCGTGAYTTCSSERYLFDLVRKKEVSIWDEIDAAGMKKLWKKLGPQLDSSLKDQRKGFSDSEWTEVLMKSDEPEWEDPEKELNQRFSWPGTTPSPGTFDGSYLDSATFHFAPAESGWFHFPHVIRNMDLYIEIPMPIPELVKYLKPGSFLRNLVKNP